MRNARLRRRHLLQSALRGRSGGSPRLHALLAAALCGLLAPVAPASAQDAVDEGAGPAAAATTQRRPAPTADDREKALAALKSIVAAYRDAKGVVVDTQVTIAAEKDGTAGRAEPVAAKFVFGSERRAVVDLRGYQLRFAGGKCVATHASNPLAYLEVSDHGSPYYALFNAFQALPFPELALALGEDDPLEVCMQLVPSIPNLQPVRVAEEELDGQVYATLDLESDDQTEELRLYFDPDTKLVERSRGVLRGGEAVEEGSALVFQSVSKVARPKDAPTDATFALDVSGRQKVDGLAALVDANEEAVADAMADKEVEALKPGEPAPDLALPLRGGGEWSLVGARPKPVVVDYWATWCGPCRAAMPEIAKLAEEFAGRAEVMLVNSGEQGSREEREQRIGEVLKSRAPGLRCVLDLDGMAARRWLVRAFPTTFLIAPDGRVAGVWEGSSPRSQRELREKLEKLCAEAASAPAEAPAPEGATGP